MDILKRSLAPITDEAWAEIDDRAKEVLSTFLSARRIVDVDGPKGLDYAGVPLGHLDVADNQSSDEVRYGVQMIQPLIETRMTFELNIWELDNIIRGAKDIDLDEMEKAAQKAALFEENAIYHGFGPGNIKGLKECTSYDPLDFEADPHQLMEAVSIGLTEFAKASVGGPYALVVSPDLWKYISSQIKGYPLSKQLEKLLGGKIILGSLTEDNFLVSIRGGDLKLVLGQDFSIGYISHSDKTVRLYFTESFTFRVIDPAAVIPVNWKK